MKVRFLVFALLIPLLAISQVRDYPSFQDDLLDHLVGRWKGSGIVHGRPTKQTIDAEWVLNHQFLRVHEKTDENVAGTNMRFEAIYFIGYDNTSKRYIAHLLDVFGGGSASVAYGQRSENEIRLTFNNPNPRGGTYNTKFILEADSKTWRIVSAFQNSGGESEPSFDLKLTPAK